MTTVERIFYSVLAFSDPSDLLPLARALRAVELHIRRECRLVTARLDAEIHWQRGQLNSLRAFKRSVDEALNSGDGSYRP